MIQGLCCGLLGVIVGLAGAAYIQTWLTGYMYKVEPFDAASFCLSAAGVLLVLLFAIWWPARRASKVDPCEALRVE